MGTATIHQVMMVQTKMVSIVKIIKMEAGMAMAEVDITDITAQIMHLMATTLLIYQRNLPLPAKHLNKLPIETA